MSDNIRPCGAAPCICGTCDEQIEQDRVDAETDERRTGLLMHIARSLDHWLDEPRATTSREKMEGLVFSVLVALDGEAGDLQGFAVVPFADDGETLLAGCDIAGSMHDEWAGMTRARRTEPGTLADMLRALDRTQDAGPDVSPPSPELRAQAARLLRATAAYLDRPMPLGNVLGDSYVRVEWMHGAREVRLMLHGRPPARDYIYHEEGVTVGPDRAVTYDVTVETLARWLGWMMEEMPDVCA